MSPVLLLLLESVKSIENRCFFISQMAAINLQNEKKESKTQFIAKIHLQNQQWSEGWALPLPLSLSFPHAKIEIISITILGDINLFAVKMVSNSASVSNTLLTVDRSQAANPRTDFGFLILLVVETYEFYNSELLRK